MSPSELKAARLKLNLSPKEAAAMLDLSTQKSVYRMEMDESCSTHVKPSARVVRLYNAYLSGYRPDDWPFEESNDAEV